MSKVSRLENKCNKGVARLNKKYKDVLENRNSPFHKRAPEFSTRDWSDDDDKECNFSVCCFFEYGKLCFFFKDKSWKIDLLYEYSCGKYEFQEVIRDNSGHWEDQEDINPPDSIKEKCFSLLYSLIKDKCLDKDLEQERKANEEAKNKNLNSKFGI